MIDRTHELPVTRQCQILSLARSTAYYRHQEVRKWDLALMRRIDELHLEHPFAGSRMLRDMLAAGKPSDRPQACRYADEKDAH
jgi:putative transposase